MRLLLGEFDREGEYAGVGVAMGNAQQVVKDVADYVTASCDEDGLVEVIKKFVL
jgi:hydroxymethylpyrimidine pyrophosphatase-like HAD family hydrolase